MPHHQQQISHLVQVNPPSEPKNVNPGPYSNWLAKILTTGMVTDRQYGFPAEAGFSD